MRIATWNVNSARSRAERMEDFLVRHNIDVLTVQETKSNEKNFPHQRFEELGYEVAHVGYNQWNGVAILSRVGLEDVEDHLPGQPGFAKDPAKLQDLEARAVGATCGGVRVWSLYIPNGREIGDRHYDYKLAFTYALAHYAEDFDGEHLLLTGDFNVAPRDEDVWDITLFDGKTHVTEPERQAFEMLLDAGLTDVGLKLAHEPYTYYDYKSMRFSKGEGMRIDFQLASAALAEAATDAFVDVAERSGKGASDHAPLVVDYQLKDYDSVR
ncbi:exodeoxyribonuclease III [Corynebacterium tapiri]|uniref:Exodeoxyribonuclease III n=1 Tax=Corynebacterium tapiri TaxID=1448266 RepID=A0A5C4U1V8_9CORY|nr:exodeoxyribonuclease III [Corynebacterium tapiri]TNL95753.1 exodeoxyribonuclease III [Corynebacterium tapiri]